jgi:YVTN family beta-propeller protein
MSSRQFARLAVLALLTISVSPALSQTVVATIPVGFSPFIVAANPRTNQVYVTNQGSNSMSVIDGSLNQVVATVKFIGAFVPYGVAVNPFTNRIYVAGGHWLYVVDGNTNAVVRQIRVGTGADRVAVNPATNRIYVTNESDGTVSAVDGARNQVIATVPVNGGPIGIAVDPVRNLVYVPLFFCTACGTAVINGSTNQVTTTLNLAGGSLDDVAVDALNNRIYVTDESAGLFAIDGNTNTVLGNVTGLNGPETVAVLPGTGLVVEADFGSGNAIFIDTYSLSISQTVAVGTYPNGTAVNWIMRRVYMSNKGSNSVSVIAY